jgi:signal transduction histidine kinase
MPNEVKLYIIGFFIGFLLLGLFIIFLSLLYSRKQLRNKQEKERIQSQFAQALLQSQLEIQEQTLQHISRELHDNLGQVASLIKINLNTIKLSETEKTEQKIENTKELTRQLITDLKSLSVSLGADRISQGGFANALEIEVDRLNKTGQFTATIRKEGSMPTMDNDKAVILYRMSQEILNNMVKHSQAQQITILLHATEHLFTLAFSDNGVGFDLEEKKKSGGAGLRNLQNRAGLISARLSMKSAPGNGTNITIQVPV